MSDSRTTPPTLLRLVLWLAAALTLVAAAPSLAAADDLSPRVEGGTRLAGADAPWAVRLILSQNGAPAEQCSGSILSTTTVLTAAHCTFDPDTNAPVAAAQIEVQAGFQGVNADGAQFSQKIAAGSIRRHPNYVQSPTGAPQPSDVAVLTLSKALTLAPGSVAVATRIPSGSPRPTGDLTAYGFGTQAGKDGTGDANWDETSRRLTVPQLSQDLCGEDNAVALCGQSPQGAGCPGDSGGGVTAVTPAGVVLVGVNRSSELPCHTGGVLWATDLSAPEVGQFVDGNNAPPTAPRYVDKGGISSKYAAVNCLAGNWTGSPSFAFTFIDANTGGVFRDLSPDAFYDGVTGQVVACRVTATNAGGTATSLAKLPSGLYRLHPYVSFSQNGTGKYRYTASDFASGRPLALQYRTVPGGPILRQVAFTNGQSPKRPVLAPGKYQTCLHSDADETWEGNDTCITEVVDGPSSRLVSFASAARQGKRWNVSLTVTGAVVGKRVKVSWLIQSRKHGRTVTRTARVKLQPTTTLRAPKTGSKAGVKLRLSMPSFKRDGVKYKSGRYEKTIRKAR